MNTDQQPFHWQRFPLAAAFERAHEAMHDPLSTAGQRNMLATWFDQSDRERAQHGIPSALVY